ncbi:HAMP domain-containing methyl-accepting chemotaxis protein [Dictyobacter kobayashii]|uniref:Methyl-accepting chemotaxis protein n=1 Tax=Dictyobacter kobayashii TaxID=2014872 RepID=A0A402AGL2_9CHLR|nr:methyl-accepting chemotaxis protein [Dictyobacter kobayashii]GCE18219.1 hypothetical protein KDK_20190 [Dictyobacter kobayashii]
MFTSISNIRIFPRLIILFATLVIISSVAMVSLGYFYLNAEQTHAQAVKTSFNAQQIATTEQINLQRMNALLQARFAQIFANENVALKGDPSLAASGGLIENDITAREINFDQTIASYDKTYNIGSSADMNTIRNILQNNSANKYLITDQQTALSNVRQTQWKAYQSLQDQVLAQLRQPMPQYEPAYAQLYQANLKFLDLQKSWQTVVTTATTVGQAVTDISNSEIVPLQIATAIAIALILLVIALTAIIVNATISRPLRRLASLTGRIAAGDMSERAHVPGRDEINMVATSMNNMLEHIVQLIGESEARHRTLQQQVEKLIREVSPAGEGDLRVQAETSSDSLGVLASFINHVISELGSLVITFKTLANEVERATLQTYDETIQLVDETDNQIQKIAVARGNIEEMANASRDVAQRAQSLSQVGNHVYHTTQSGRNALQRTVEGMGRINNQVHLSASRVQALEEHSQEINNIVRIISGIAYQTNRLALDASIQAAMAGENGRAFRAVADDIRRSAETAKTQANMIEKIVQQVFQDIEAVTHSIQETELEAGTGIQSSQDAGTAFAAIVNAIEQQSSEINTINQAAMQQLSASSTVAQIMQDVYTSTLRSGHSIREESTRMERVAQLAEQLLGSAEVFKLSEDQDIFAQATGMTEQNTFPQAFYAGANSGPLPHGMYPSQINPSMGSIPLPPIAGQNLEGDTSWNETHTNSQPLTGRQARRVSSSRLTRL